MVDVSVIVPAYNIEEYIGECVESIINQTMKNIEIILVDDGSVDNTLNILHKYEKLDNRVKVVAKVNGGVTSARKAGLLEARGEYISFVDGDDYLDKNMLGELYQAAVDNQVDGVYNQMFYKVYEGKVSIKGNNLVDGKYDLKEDDYIWQNIWNKDNKRGFFASQVCNLYRKELAFRTYEGISDKVSFGEDEMFTLGYLSKAESVYVMHKSLYYYRVREGSACNKVLKNFLSGIEECYNYLIDTFVGNKREALIVKQIKYMKVNDLFQLRFLQSNSVAFHMFPYEKIEKNCRIILYGAGEVGRSYYKQIMKNNYCEILSWVDVRYEKLGKEISSPKEIENLSYDYILIAILDMTMAQNIAKEISEKYCVDVNKIIVYSPKSVVEFLDIEV